MYIICTVDFARALATIRVFCSPDDDDDVDLTDIVAVSLHCSLLSGTEKILLSKPTHKQSNERRSKPGDTFSALSASEKCSCNFAAASTGSSQIIPMQCNTSADSMERAQEWAQSATSTQWPPRQICYLRYVPFWSLQGEFIVSTTMRKSLTLCIHTYIWVVDGVCRMCRQSNSLAKRQKSPFVKGGMEWIQSIGRRLDGWTE